MENENIITLQLQLTRRKAFLLLTFFFLCWHPRFLGSETMTLTTYYPAPYGGYASILTTGQTLLARDSGRVGIGTASPTQKLDVQGGNISTSGELLANSGSGRIYYTAGEGETIRLAGNNGLYMHMENLNGAFRLINNPWTLDIFNVNQTGDVRVQGSITNLCSTVQYQMTGNLAPWPCPAGTRAIAYYGDGVARVTGILTNSSQPAGVRIGLGEDWNGWELCCKIQ